MATILRELHIPNELFPMEKAKHGLKNKAKNGVTSTANFALDKDLILKARDRYVKLVLEHDWSF